MKRDLFICSSRRFIRMECLIAKFRLEEEEGKKEEETLRKRKRREKEFQLINYLLVIRRYRLKTFLFVFSLEKRKSEMINSRNFARRWIPSRFRLMNLFGKGFILIYSLSFLFFFKKLWFCWLNFVLINLKRSSSYSSINNIDKLTSKKLYIIKFL